MMLVDSEKVKEVISISMNTGFHMGATSMRLKVMETITPYLDNSLIDSGLLTVRDVFKIVADILTDYDIPREYEIMKDMMEKLNDMGDNDSTSQI